jgi:shikimate dehydrogenase
MFVQDGSGSSNEGSSPDRYSVAGNPVDHSLSPRIHGLFAAQTGQDMRYGRLLIPENMFAKTVAKFFTDGGCGLNVTVPCKGHAFDWVGSGRSSRLAVRARAVNTIHRSKDGYRGDNTDGVGLTRDLAWHGVAVAGMRILLLGAGGAVRGVLPSLAEAGPDAIVIANRTRATAESLALDWQGADVPAVSACALDEIEGRFDLVINGTSAGLGGAVPMIPEASIAEAFCYDMLYGQKAAFHQWARTIVGDKSMHGLGMLIEQAAEAFCIWRGVMPDTKRVRTALMDIAS